MANWKEWGCYAGLVSSGLGLGLAIKSLYDEWKEARELREIRRAKREIMDQQELLFAKAMSQNNDLLEKAYKMGKGS